MPDDVKVVTPPTNDDGGTSRAAMITAILDQVPKLIPGVPNSAWMPILGTGIRSLGMFMSASGIAYGRYISGEETTILLYALLGAAALGWSVWQKIKAELNKWRVAANSAVDTAERTAVASAAAGTPMPVASIPPAKVIMTPNPHEAAKAGAI